MKEVGELVLLALIVVFCAAILFADLKLQSDCEHGGGHYVRGMWDMECVK